MCLSLQNAMVSFKELCGLTPAANMKQCILTVSTWLMNSERSLRVTVDLSETYPTMEAQGPVPELLRKVLNAYDMVKKPQDTYTSPRPPIDYPCLDKYLHDIKLKNHTSVNQVVPAEKQH